MTEHNELEALRNHWEAHKKETGETQVTAATKMEMKQAAFNQYLTGSITINAMFIMKFSRLVGINPVRIRPRLSVIFGKLRGKALTEKLDGTIHALGVRKNEN